MYGFCFVKVKLYVISLAIIFDYSGVLREMYVTVKMDFDVKDYGFFLDFIIYNRNL